MKFINKETFEIGVNKSGSLYWKPEWDLINDGFLRVVSGREFKYINTWSYYVPTTIRLFWLKFFLYIKIKPKLISGTKPMKYVKFEKTHLSLTGIKEGNWSDKPPK